MGLLVGLVAFDVSRADCNLLATAGDGAHGGEHEPALALVGGQARDADESLVASTSGRGNLWRCAAVCFVVVLTPKLFDGFGQSNLGLFLI